MLVVALIGLVALVGLALVGLVGLVGEQRLGVYAQIAANTATVFGVLGAAVGVAYAGNQLRAARGQLEAAREQLGLAQRTAHGEFVLRLDEMFRDHTEVHLNLRPGGAWAPAAPAEGGEGAAAAGPCTAAEWALVEAYMGLFGRIYLLIQDGVVSPEEIRYAYGYRLLNIVANDVIHAAKIRREGRSWSNFIALWRLLYPADWRLPPAEQPSVSL